MRLFVFYVCGICFIQNAFNSEISTQSYFYGPGLRPEFDVPVRYFFIQAVSVNGSKVTNYEGENPFSIKFHSGSDHRISYANKILNLNNGTFLVIFRFFRSYEYLYLQVFVDNDELLQSPHILNRPIMHTDCNCPYPMSEWRSSLACPSYSFNGTTLDYFPEIKLNGLADRIYAKFPHASLVHYSIKDNKIYRETFGRYTDFKMFSDELLLYLTKKVTLPDMEFFMNLGDWPQERDHADPLPIISWCGNKGFSDIIIPTYDLTRSTLFGLHRQELDVLMAYGHVGPSWRNKKPQALFRGRDSRQERLDLVEHGRKQTDKYDVGLTHFFFFKHDEDKFGPIVSRIGFFDFFAYRYQLSLDGTVAAYRLPFLLSGSSLVLKQESPYYEHFYRFLRPGVHYVSFSKDLTELDSLLDWAESNESEVCEIVESSRRLAEEHLFPDKIMCYTAMLLEEYATRLKGKVKIHPGMELVEQTMDICPVCKTHRDEL